MKGHKLHPRYLALTRLDAQAWNGSAFIALDGAAYHYAMIKSICDANTGGQHGYDEKGDLLVFAEAGSFNRFQWHLRAFFWEIVSTFDFLAHQINEAFGLGLPEHDISWKSLPAPNHTSDPRYRQAYALLGSVYGSEWYSEVVIYRNFAHRAFIPITSVVFKKPQPTSRHAWIVMEPAIQARNHHPDVRDKLSEHLDETRKAATAIHNIISPPPI